MNKIFSATFSAMSAVGAAGVIVLTLVTCIDVIGRYIFNSPLNGAFEISQNLLVLITACGIPLATLADQHISVDVIFQKLSTHGRKVLTLIGCLLGFVAFAVLCWRGIVAVVDSILPVYEITDRLKMVTYPFRMILAAGFFLSAMALIKLIVHLVRPKTSELP